MAPIFILLLLLALFMPSVALAQADHLDTYSTKYYTIHTNLSREDAVPFGRHMDSIFGEYLRRFWQPVALSREPLREYSPAGR